MHFLNLFSVATTVMGQNKYGMQGVIKLKRKKNFFIRVMKYLGIYLEFFRISKMLKLFIVFFY